MPTNFDYSTLLTDDQPDDSGFDYSTLLEDSAGTKTGKAIQRVGDTAIALGKGVVGVPQAITGIANVFTGGEAGKAVEESGVRFKDAQDILSGLQSPEQKAANAEVANANGFVDTAKAAIDNPSTIVNSVAESLPAMGVGGVVARGGIGAAGLISRGLAEKAVPVMAGLGEGAVTAGQIAEQVREENKDGLLTDKQALAAAGAGIVTGGIGAAAAKLVNTKFGQRLGLADMDVLIAKGGPDAVTASAAKTGFIKSMLSSGFSEGVLEELPQSAQEQMWQNYAQGKPITEGVGNAAATGLLAGAAMGAAGGGYSAAMGKESDQPQQEQTNGSNNPEQTQNAQGLNDSPVVQPVDGQDGNAIPSTEDAIDRISELEIKASQDGLTPQEQAEHQALSQSIAENLAQENQETPTPEAAQPETQPTGEVQPAESIVPAEPSQPFQPTHTLSDGTPVKFDQEENAYVGADGSLYEPDGYEAPITEAQTGTEPNPNSGENAPAQAVISQDMANVQPENASQLGEVLPGNSEVQSQGDTGQAQKPQPLSKNFIPTGTELNWNRGSRGVTKVRTTGDVDLANTQAGQIIPLEIQRENGSWDAANINVDFLHELVSDTLNPKKPQIGAWTIEQRKQNAAKSFMDSAREQFGLSQDEAQSALDYYQREKLVTLDGITGQFKLKHGPLWESSAIRLAAYQEKFPKASDAVIEILRKAAEAKSKPVRDSYLREAEKLHGETKPAKPAKNNLTSPPTGKEELQAAIRKLGGIKREGIADRAGFTDFKGRKYTGLFNNGKNAKTLDEMAELLRGYDYQIDGENDLIEKLYNSLNGQPHYSPAGAEAYATKLIEESAKAEQAQADDENAIEAAEERAAIQAADDIEPDAEYDEIFETVLSNDRRNTGRITNLDDVFGPETAGTEESTGAADTGTTVQRAAESGAQAGNNTETDRESQKQQRSQSKGGDEKGNQGNEQASGGISDKAKRTAELFKANPQKIINGLTSTGKIKQLHNAAGVMTSAGFKDLPMADKVAAYVKMVTGEIIPGEPKPKGAPVETDLFVNSEEERKALEAKQGAANVAAAKDKKRQGDGAEPPPLFSDNPAMAGQVDIEDAQQTKQPRGNELRGNVAGNQEGIHAPVVSDEQNDKPVSSQKNQEQGVSAAAKSKKENKADNDLSKTWDSMDYGAKQEIAKASKLSWNRSIVHRVSHSKWSELGDLEKQDLIAASMGQSKPDQAKLAPGTRINGDLEKKQADRLLLVAQQLRENKYNDIPRNSPEGNALRSIENVAQELMKLKTVVSVVPLLEQASFVLNRKFPPVAELIDEIAEKLTTGEVPDKSTGEVDQAALDADRFKDNKIFTADKVAAARERLKAKLGTLNSGFDPELALDGMTIAGAYIESGIKAYADYTKAMIADLGEGVRPYLRSFYESVRAYPGMDKTGMTSHAELEAADRYKIHHGEMWSFDGKPAREVKSVNEHYIGFTTKDDAGKFDVSVGNFSQQKDRWQKVTEVTANPDKSAITKPGQSKDNAKFNEAQDYAKRPQDAEQASAETGNSEKDRSPWGDSQPDSGQVDSRLAKTNQETGNTGATDSGSKKTSGTRTGSGRVRAQKQLDGRNRGKANSGDRSESGTTKPDSVSLPSEPKADFTATAETAEAITEGGQKTKARANIAAIKLVKQLVAEDRRATMDEQKALARYVGWGGIKQIFDEDNTAWSSLRTELKNILTAEEYAAANRSILDAHYTGLDVVNGMWGIAKHLGFKGGRLLEPSMGVGNFFGAMPHDMRVNSTMFGVELDNITGAIAKYLYPNARINAPVGFQDVVIPSNSFDFATGNPPFGEHSLYDKDHPEFRSFAIHQFFFAKTLDTLRPGGIQAFVVSRYLMDSRDGNGMAARKYLSENARLVGAMRLPYNAFLSNANTEVVTDIIILQKLAEGEKGNADEWTSMTDINVVHPDGTPSTFSVNKYFADHPEMVLGTHSNTGKMRAKYQYNVEPIAGESLQYSIEKATKHLPKDIYKPAEKPLVELATQADEVPEGTKVYGFFVDGDRVMQRVPDSMGNRQAVQIDFKDTKSPERAKGLIKIRDALRDLMRSELSRTADNAELEAKRSKLNQVYDAFVKEHGFVNRDVNRRVMRDDPDYPLLESLEPNYDAGLGSAAAKARGEKERKPTADKADIFRERVLYPFQTISKAETAKDALIASLNEKGGIDQDFMADIYSKPWESIEAELGELIYQNPAGGYETADAYLAGNVKAKLRLAEEAVKENPAYQRNVEALKAVQPADIPALKISVRLGSPWVDSAAMADFAKEILGKRTNASIRFVPQIAKWMVSIEDFDPVARVSVWGTQRMPANELLEHILNNKPIVVKDNLGTSREPQWVVNETETESARAKAQDMSAKFKEWIWQDQDRRDRLAKIYNQNYNTDRRRVYDGAHLTLPGSSNAIQLRPHQKNAIWRALQDRTILLDQVVGAGKTFIMAGIAMEMRRLGIARKPMFMVPNSLVRQWRDEFYKLYPNANVLAATENDFAKVNRKRFMAKIATGDWDAVVVAHSSFKKIGMPEAQERKILDDQLKEIADAIEEMKRERGDKNVMRDMQRIKEKLEEKLKALNDRGGKKDDTVSFDELGVDALFLDEAHLFKNLFYISGMRNIAGLGNPSGSGRAFDLFVKTQFLAENYSGKAPIVFATGTPVSNSLVEMFTMQRYLAWSKLKDANIHLLDAWAGVYGDVQNVYEVHPSGTGYRLSTRFAKFVNLPSLMNLYRGFADIITMDDLKKQAIDRGERFPVPKVKGGKPTLVVAPRSDLQTRFFGEPEFLYNEDGSIRFKYDKAPSSYIIDKTVDGKYAVFYRISGDQGGSNRVSQSYDTKEEAEEDLQRGLVTPEVAWNEGSILWKFENLKELTKKTNGKINALSITNEARKAGLDYRLINPAAPDFKDSKVNKAVENVLRIHKAWAKDKGTQLVFCDLSVPQSAKAAAASAERDAFVRREGGELKKVKATIAQIEGMDRAFLVVKMGKKEETRFMVYDGVTGADLEIEGATRAEAVKALTDASNNDLSFADKFEQFAPIEDADIADWKDANNSEGEDDEEGDGAISMDELLSMGSTNKFSVYDDIKTKLIKKGIPEKEIAFIHDYNTAVKKGKLFDLVNAGEIRVLIGSTEKMGAGMNVQKRLVGLHHLDAPWRPSDLEQREGRIIRQGNELYKRDPDNFEVEIMRYGTKQTYDTRMWQIIEHKAAGVEQLRKANDDMLEIDDVGGEAANAADMKAAASGNPLILDEIKLRNETKSLEAQQFGHMQAQVELQDKLKNYKNAKQIEREKLAGIQPLLDIRDKNPAKPFSFIDENGNDHKETKEAEAPITKAMIAVAKGSLGTEMVAGKYRGFDVTFERGGFGVNVDLVTNSDQSLPVTTYGPDDKFSVSGLFTRIENALSRLDDRVNDIKDDAKYKTDQIPAIEKELGKPFAKEDQLKEARTKHRNVVNQLAKSGGGIELTDAMKKELDAALAARGVSDTRLSIGANTAPTPSLVDLFEKMGKRSSKSATINHPQADLIRAIQDGGWQDVLLQVGYEKADKSDNPNGKVFIQC